MEIISLESNNIDPKIIKRATKVLRAGGIIICPSDTSYMLVANATNPTAIKKIFEIKGRSLGKPVHVVFDSLYSAKRYLKFGETAEKLAKAFLPGPLTIVLPIKKTLPLILTSGLPKLGFRIPDLELNISLAKNLARPYTATSANKSGLKDSYKLQDVLSELTPRETGKIDLALDGGMLGGLLPSTVVDCSEEIPKILRSGPITKKQIEKALGIAVD